MGEVKLVNLTPHEIKIVGKDGEVKQVIPPSGKVARVKTEQIEIGEVDGIKIVKTVFGELKDCQSHSQIQYTLLVHWWHKLYQIGMMLLPPILHQRGLSEMKITK